MLKSGPEAAAAAQNLDEQELVRFKAQMDNLKKRLAKDPDKEKELRKACQDFEAVFISKLWQEMKSTVPKHGYLHGPQEDMYLSMFDRSFAEKMSQSGGIGLADMLYDNLKDRLRQASRENLPGRTEAIPIPASDLPAAELKDRAVPLRARAEPADQDLAARVDALASRIMIENALAEDPDQAGAEEVGRELAEKK
ncbi:MAG: rod-binding protein [Desulfovibrionaceae bacterium]|nr:rod-binding protein [Desulfovibrionaceae bacterium]